MFINSKNYRYSHLKFNLYPKSGEVFIPRTSSKILYSGGLRGIKTPPLWNPSLILNVIIYKLSVLNHHDFQNHGDLDFEIVDLFFHRQLLNNDGEKF